MSENARGSRAYKLYKIKGCPSVDRVLRILLLLLLATDAWRRFYRLRVCEFASEFRVRIGLAQWRDNAPLGHSRKCFWERGRAHVPVDKLARILGDEIFRLHPLPADGIAFDISSRLICNWTGGMYPAEMKF